MELFNIGGIFTVILLVSGIVLTIITIRRMVSGQLSLPGWAKVLLSASMILMSLITLLRILPPVEVNVTIPFISEDTHVVTPADPSYETTATP